MSQLLLIKVFNREEQAYNSSMEEMCKAIKVLEANGFEVSITDPYTALYESELLKIIEDKLVLSSEELDFLSDEQVAKLTKIVYNTCDNKQDNVIDFEYLDQVVRDAYNQVVYRK